MLFTDSTITLLSATRTRWTIMKWTPLSPRPSTPRKCPWPSVQTPVKTLPRIPHSKLLVPLLALKKTALDTKILYSQHSMGILLNQTWSMDCKLQIFNSGLEEDGVFSYTISLWYYNLFKACCDMTRYFLVTFISCIACSENHCR